MKALLIYPVFLLIFFSSPVYSQSPLGTYEQVVENHSKQTVSIKKVNSYEEVEHRWRDGKWVFKCRYIGVWSVVGDTLVLKPLRVVWQDKHITTCRDQDDNQQPGCCFSYKFFYDEKSIWTFGELSNTKYVYKQVKTEGE